MVKKYGPVLVFPLIIVLAFAYSFFLSGKKAPESFIESTVSELNALSIEKLKDGSYPGSDLVIEQTLESGINYNRYIAFYKSEGLKIYGLLTVPVTQKPEAGFPAIIFNHGFISPKEYRTTERYIAYTDAFSRNGYVVFKSDYRGHGNSEGEASGVYGSTGYTIDVLNALSSIKKYADVNPNRIGMWGHSLGGYLTLRVMVVDPTIRVGVIWGGVVASYEDLLYNWRRRTTPPTGIPSGGLSWRQGLISKYGDPSKNPKFWESISATSFLSNISGPVQLHHSTTDQSVPVEFSRKLAELLKAQGKTVEFYEYDGDDHNISKNFTLAMQRSVDFFDKYLK